MEARYKIVCGKVVEFIEGQNIINYPLTSEKLKKIILRNGWKLLPYGQYDDSYNISADGFTTIDYETNEFIIHYNDSIIEERKCFTLGHEIGHIIMNHHIEYKKDILCNNEDVKNKLEKEANCFARNFLSPSIIIKKLEDYICEPLNENDIVNIFKISGEFARNRIGWVLNKDIRYSEYKNPNIFDDFIESVRDKVDYHLFDDFPF